MEKKFRWVDYLKGLAIFAVILDHLFYVTYTNETLHSFTIYSVSLFIFLAGVTSVISIQNNQNSWPSYLLRRAKSILIPYVIASLIYVVITLNYRFDWDLFWNSLIRFNASPPLYFVLFFIELVIISPILYKLLYKKKFIFQLGLLIVVYFLSNWLTTHTSINGVILGGGKVFGGTYLFVFFIGQFFCMTYQMHRHLFVKRWTRLVAFSILVLLSVIFAQAQYIKGAWSNPPNNYAMIYAVLVFTMGLLAHALLAKHRATNFLIKYFEVIGKHSYVIFLYHSLVIHCIWDTTDLSQIPNGVFKTILYMAISILIPLTFSIAIRGYKANKKNIKDIILRFIETN